MRAIPDGYYQPIPEATDEQRAAIHRLVAGRPEADLLERMLTGAVLSVPNARGQSVPRVNGHLKPSWNGLSKFTGLPLSAEVYRGIEDRYFAGVPVREICEEFGVSRDLVYRRLNGRSNRRGSGAA